MAEAKTKGNYNEANDKYLPYCGGNEPIAPDRDYSWVVLFASFIINVIVDGVCFAFGIFYPEFLDYFQESRGKTAWIGSVLNGTYMIMGPIAGALCKQFGGRIVSIVGSVWACIAFISCTFSNNVNHMIITYGVLGGIGFGLLYLPSILMVGFYFDKRRALATGIATCGSGVGTFLFAVLCNGLLYLYGWRGAQWVVAAIVLNGAAMGALYRPLTATDMEKYRRKWRIKHYGVACELSDPECPKLMTSKTANNNNVKSQQPDQNLNSLETTHSLQTGDFSHAVTAEKEKAKSAIHAFLSSVAETMDFHVLKNPVFDVYAFSCILCMAAYGVAITVSMYYSGFFIPFTYLPDKALRLGYTHKDAAILLSILGAANTIARVIAGWLSDRSWADCLMINNVCLIVGGIATIACPFCTNFAMLAVYALIFGTCIGLYFILFGCAFLTKAFLHALFSAAFVCLRSIILIDLIGLDTLTSSFGLLVLSQGISTFFGAPLAGFLYDITGSYDLSFYVAGTFIALAGAICLPLRRLKRCQNKNKE